MTNNKPNSIDKFFDDATGFVQHTTGCTREKATLVVSTLSHDISAIVRGDRCFLPRVAGYAEVVEKKSKK